MEETRMLTILTALATTFGVVFFVGFAFWTIRYTVKLLAKQKKKTSISKNRSFKYTDQNDRRFWKKCLIIFSSLLATLSLGIGFAISACIGSAKTNNWDEEHIVTTKLEKNSDNQSGTIKFELDDLLIYKDMSHDDIKYNYRLFATKGSDMPYNQISDSSSGDSTRVLKWIVDYNILTEGQTFQKNQSIKLELTCHIDSYSDLANIDFDIELIPIQKALTKDSFDSQGHLTDKNVKWDLGAIKQTYSTKIWKGQTTHDFFYQIHVQAKERD